MNKVTQSASAPGRLSLVADKGARCAVLRGHAAAAGDVHERCSSAENDDGDASAEPGELTGEPR